MCCHTQSPETSALSEAKALRLAKFLTTHVGCSLSLDHGHPAAGYMVSVVAGPTYQTKQIEKERKLRWDTYVDYTYEPVDLDLQVIADWIQGEYIAERYFGSWLDMKTFKVYIDVSVCIYDRQTALNLARSRNEIAIWDVRNNCEIRLEYPE